MSNLLTKYRPRQLGELLGQPWVSEQLQLFANNPYPTAFLFEGDTGTGKTSAALLLAEALGVQIDQEQFGGLHQIASGEQTGETVRRMMESMRCRPFFGSGWKVLVVNEADAMTPNAAFVWLDALEDLPPQTVIIFTTNAACRIPARLRDRCERLAFESSALLLRPYLQQLTDRIWREEGCAGSPPDVEKLSLADDNGNASFRRLVQKLTPYIRAGAVPASPKLADKPEDRLHVYGRRWAGGERINQLAKEAGTSWNRLWSELTALGYKKGA
jgi:hypothetical protein